MLNVLIQHKKEKVDLERFWKPESLGVTETETTTTDVNSYDAYESGITYKDSHYKARLPWKDYFSELPINYNVTKRRTINVINRLKKETELPQTYGEIKKDQEKKVALLRKLTLPRRQIKECTTFHIME